MAVGTGVGVDEGEIVGVVVEVLAVDDIVVGTGSSAGVEVKEGDSVPSTVVVAIGVGVGVGSVGVDVQAISANTKAGTARNCHPVRFKWSRRLAVVERTPSLAESLGNQLYSFAGVRVKTLHLISHGELSGRDTDNGYA